MKRAIIFGAGQAGRMVRKWLKAGVQLVAYADNDVNKQKAGFDGLPVYNARRAVDENVDVIIIATLNEEAVLAIRKVLFELGYDGETQDLKQHKYNYDLRLAEVRLVIEEIKKRDLEGDIAELGVYQGDLAVQLNSQFPDRTLHLFDTFNGFDLRDMEVEEEQNPGIKQFQDFSGTSLEEVRARLPHPDRVLFYPGFFPDTLPNYELDFALVSLDVDLYQPTYEGLSYFYPRMVKGGVIIIDDYNSMQYEGVKQAVDSYCEEMEIMVLPLVDIHGACVIVKN